MPSHVSAAEAPEDLWRCHDCGWTYPNHHPSAKHRRNHKKQCGKLSGFPSTEDYKPDLSSSKRATGSSDDASSDEERRRSPPRVQEMKIQLEDRCPSQSLQPANGPVVVEQTDCNGSTGKSFTRNALPGGKTFDDASSPGLPKSVDEIAYSTRNLGIAHLKEGVETPNGSQQALSQHGRRSLRSAHAVKDEWICRHCGWTYPNAHPSAKHRRKHKKKCGAGGASNTGMGGSSDDASSDEDQRSQIAGLENALDTSSKPGSVDSAAVPVDNEPPHSGVLPRTIQPTPVGAANASCNATADKAWNVDTFQSHALISLKGLTSELEMGHDVESVHAQDKKGDHAESVHRSPPGGDSQNGLVFVSKDGMELLNSKPEGCFTPEPHLSLSEVGGDLSGFVDEVEFMKPDPGESHPIVSEGQISPSESHRKLEQNLKPTAGDHFQDTEDLWTCQYCGWTYPNAHPSAKHRRNHKKKCGQVAVAVHEGSSDDAASDDEHHLVQGTVLQKDEPAPALELLAGPSSERTILPVVPNDAAILERSTNEAQLEKTDERAKRELRMLSPDVLHSTSSSSPSDVDPSASCVENGHSDRSSAAGGLVQEEIDSVQDMRTSSEGQLVLEQQVRLDAPTLEHYSSGLNNAADTIEAHVTKIVVTSDSAEWHLRSMKSLIPEASHHNLPLRLDSSDPHTSSGPDSPIEVTEIQEPEKVDATKDSGLFQMTLGKAFLDTAKQVPFKTDSSYSQVSLVATTIQEESIGVEKVDASDNQIAVVNDGNRTGYEVSNCRVGSATVFDKQSLNVASVQVESRKLHPSEPHFAVSVEKDTTVVKYEKGNLGPNESQVLVTLGTTSPARTLQPVFRNLQPECPILARIQGESQSPAGMRCSPGSPEGLVRSRVEEFERLAGVDTQHRRISLSPTKSSSPQTSGTQHLWHNGSTCRTGSYVHEILKESQEPLAHLRHQQSNEKRIIASSNHQVPLEVQEVMSHLRHRSDIVQRDSPKAGVVRTCDTETESELVDEKQASPAAYSPHVPRLVKS